MTASFTNSQGAFRREAAAPAADLRAIFDQAAAAARLISDTCCICGCSLFRFAAGGCGHSCCCLPVCPADVAGGDDQP